MSPSVCGSVGDTVAGNRREGQTRHTAIFIMSEEHHASCAIIKKPSVAMQTHLITVHVWA